jgi:hypothetical protein
MPPVRASTFIGFFRKGRPCCEQNESVRLAADYSFAQTLEQALSNAATMSRGRTP